MTPNKIYLNKYMIRPGMLYPAQYPADTPEFEYILKDALLEWAKEKKKQLLENESANDEPSDVAAGINAGLDMVIGKLNSM